MVLAAAELTPANTSLADLATQRANAALAAQKAQREAEAAKEEAEQREAAREIEEGIKVLEDQRRSVARAGISLGNRSGLSRELAVPGEEYATLRHEDVSNVEQFEEVIEWGGKSFNTVRLSCPQPSMSHGHFDGGVSHLKVCLDGVVGTTYLAEPMLREHSNSQDPPKLSVNAGASSETAVLELHETVFYSPYYSNSGMLS